jgi:fucose permease
MTLLRALTWSGLLATGVLATGYALQRSFPAGLVVLAIYAVPIAMLNTAVAPLLLDAAPREYLGRVMAVFSPVNQFASILAVVVSQLADEHRAAELPRLVRWHHPQLGQPDIHRRRRPDLRLRHPRVRGPALRFSTSAS